MNVLLLQRGSQLEHRLIGTTSGADLRLVVPPTQGTRIGTRIQVVRNATSAARALRLHVTTLPVAARSAVYQQARQSSFLQRRSCGVTYLHTLVESISQCSPFRAAMERIRSLLLMLLPLYDALVDEEPLNDFPDISSHFSILLRARRLPLPLPGVEVSVHL